MKNKKYRGAIVALSAIAVFLAALLIFLSIWWFGFTYPAFDGIATAVAPIPGLESGISPQGICVLPQCEENLYGYDFAMSGYISGEPSRVYFIDADGSWGSKYVTFTKNGEPVKTHFGGVTATDAYMYIASGSEIIRIKLSDLWQAPYGSDVEIVDSFDVGLGAAFCYAYGGQLFVGEFYRPGNYETDPSHHIDVNGKTNHAFVYVYALDEESEGGVADMVPSKVISIPDQVQGIAVTDDKIYLSTSYGLPDSKLFVYDNELDGETEYYHDFGDAKVPHYFLDPKDSADLVMPCMSEEICVYDGKLYILFESMSKKYRYVVHYRISEIYAIDLKDL